VVIGNIFACINQFLGFCRGYTGKKLEDNVQCEIFQTILDEAKESYPPQIVFELQSNNPDDMENNIEKITQWIDQYKQNINMTMQS
jgi:adenylate kinase